MLVIIPVTSLGDGYKNLLVLKTADLLVLFIEVDLWFHGGL